jgi:hypothetical protein
LLLTILEILGGLVGALIVGVILYLVGTNWLRPDLFRFESVGFTTRPAVLKTLEDRLAALRDLSASDLAAIPEQRDELVQLDGRDAVLCTTRVQLPDGAVQVVVTACVKELPGLIMRPVGIAARGFRAAGEARTSLTDVELRQLAEGADASLLYARSGRDAP